jgi:hypothetical protein
VYNTVIKIKLVMKFNLSETLENIKTSTSGAIMGVLMTRLVCLICLSISSIWAWRLEEIAPLKDLGKYYVIIFLISGTNL